MIVKMKKLSIVGLKSEKKRVLDLLRASGCFELSSIADEPTKEEAKAQFASNSDALTQRLHTLESAVNGLEKSFTEYKDELKNNKKVSKKGEFDKASFPAIKDKKPLFSYRREVDIEEISTAKEEAEEAYKLALDVLSARSRSEEIIGLIEQNKRKIAELAPFSEVDVPLFGTKETKHFVMRLGTMRHKKAEEVRLQIEGRADCSFKSYKQGKKEDIVFVSVPIDERFWADEILQKAGLKENTIESELPPLERIEGLKEENRALYNERLQILYGQASNKELSNTIKLYHDSVMLEIEEMDSLSKTIETKKTFVILGWVPSESAASIAESIRAEIECVDCKVIEPTKEETPPTLTRSSALVSPYEAVTNMYSPPHPFERDPNPFVGFFFFIFFGIMIGDAIYGACLFLLTFIIMRCYKMDTGFKKLMMIMCMGGVSAFIWGAVYNSWAAVGLPYNPLLNPVSHPFDFLIISLGLGYLQIMFGFILKLIANLRGRDYISALADSGFKLMIMIGGAINLPSVLSMFEKQFSLLTMPSIPPVLGYIGLGLIGTGLLGMLLTGGRHKHSLGGKIVSGLGSWYDLVGLLSDVLSYCRLFGLALSGAIIGMVANILAKDVLFDIPVVGYALGIAVAVFFHVFNLALACLGAYVHNSRLQFVEFFGKFYEGGGRTFKPLGQGTKYTLLTNKK